MFSSRGTVRYEERGQGHRDVEKVGKHWCRVSCRSKFGKLVHLVGFIIKKFVTMHGHMNVKRRRRREPSKCSAASCCWVEN